MTLNSALLNDESFYAGSGATKFISATGLVTVSGTATTTSYKGLSGSVTVRAVPSLKITPVIGLSGLITGRAAVVSGSLHTLHPMRGGQVARAVTRGTAHKRKRFVGRVSGRAVTSARANKSAYLKTSITASVVTEFRLSPFAALRSAALSAASAYGSLYFLRGFQGGTVARMVSEATLNDRDLRPAPDDRHMLVPFEDRKMMVV